MGSSVVVRGGACGAFASSCLLHLRADSGEGGGEVFEGPSGCSVRVADGVGDDLQLSSAFIEGRDKGRVLLGLFFDLNVATEVSA